MQGATGTQEEDGAPAALTARVRLTLAFGSGPFDDPASWPSGTSRPDCGRAGVMPVVDDVLQQVGVGAARDDIEEAARFGMAISSVTEGGGLVDAPGRWLVGANTENPH